MTPSEFNRYRCARAGDNLITPFQCDFCHFLNIYQRAPVTSYAPDLRVLKCIRRSNLDAFWASEPQTVRRNLDEAKRGIAIASSLGFSQSLFRPLGPFPITDSFGMSAAIVMQLRSLEKGKYANHLQFDTIRKFRSAVSNIYHASVEGQKAVVMAKDTRKLVVTECPTYSQWYEKCIKGMHKRLGDDVRPDRALSFEILLAMFDLLDKEWLSPMSDPQRLALALEASLYVIAYTLALRGEELPLVHLGALRRHWDHGSSYKVPHVIIPLLGRFKNEVGESFHLMPVVAETPGGLKPRLWIGRAIQEYEKKGILSGHFFQNSRGERLRMSDLEPPFFDRLESVHHLHPSLFSHDCNVSEEYGLSRSFRRGATSVATNRGATNETIEANGRWRKSHQSGSRRPNVTIREHYTDIRLILDQLLTFSQHL